MAITATVTKKSVSFIQPKLQLITFNLVLNDGGTKVLDKDISCNLAQGDTAASRISFVKGLMQDEIDRYKAEKTIFESAALNNAVTTLNNELTT